MRKLLLSLFAAAMIAGEAAEVTPDFVTLDYGVPTAISPNGRYAVGFDTFEPYRSFLFDNEANEFDWVTTQGDLSDPAVNLDLSGMFSGVNDSGVIVGACRDKDNYIYFLEMEEPLYTAALWKDGELTKLGYGDFAKEEFIEIGAGTFAVAVSEDGKKVVGYAMRGYGAYYTPCHWLYNETTGNWDFARYVLPDGFTDGEIGSISADGSIAVGYAKKGMLIVPVYWTAPDKCVQIEFTPEDQELFMRDFNYNYAYTVSPNGEYILFTLNNLIYVPCVYSVKDKTYTKIFTDPDCQNINIRAIADNGDVFGSRVSGGFLSGGEKYETFWYSYENKVMTSLDYFTGLHASTVESLPSLKSSEIRTVSADGSSILGKVDGNVFILHTDKERGPIPAPAVGIKAENNKLMTLNISWEAPASVPSGFILQKYNVYVDGEKAGTTDPSVTTLEVTDLMPGKHTIEIEQEYLKPDGTAILSPMSESVTAAITQDFSIPLYENFESLDFDMNGWKHEVLKGQAIDYLDWHYRTVEDNNISQTLCFIAVSSAPYESVISTRYLDATELKHVYVSFGREAVFANRDDWDTTADWLSLEISLDGKTWSPILDYLAEDALRGNGAGQWIYEKIDLSDIAAGKMFKLRFNAHGEAKGQFIWYIDNFKVGSEDEVDAPLGLQAEMNDKKVELSWKNTIDAYELSYLENSNRLYEIFIGDEGNPFIVANSFDAEQMKKYEGKYITSVSTLLYDMPGLEIEHPTRSSIMIYADNEVICEQEFENYDNGNTITIKLDSPIRIEAGKEYKIGMKIFDYHPEQMPIYYQCTTVAQPWKSDLYSQDGGKTWKSLYEYYQGNEEYEEWGLCVWPIRANITDESEIYDNTTLSATIAGYNVYRNGTRINDMLSYPSYLRFTDENPLTVATYQIAAFYKDGTSSELSEPVTVNTSGVDRVKYTEVEVYPNPATDYVNIRGEFDSAVLYDVTGAKLLTTADKSINVSGLPSGVYLLSVKRGASVKTHRVMVR